MAKKETVNVDALRAEIEAEVRAEMQLETQKKLEQEEAKRKALEEKLKKDEKNLEAQIAKEEKTIKQQLDAMKKVTIEIPEDPNNPDDIVPVGWQGVIYAIPRGQQFEVPEVIYQVWKESYQKTKEVNKRIRESVRKEIQVL